ncbi:unnamed protein product, partial [Polarella glacialis]
AALEMSAFAAAPSRSATSHLALELLSVPQLAARAGDVESALEASRRDAAAFSAGRRDEEERQLQEVLALSMSCGPPVPKPEYVDDEDELQKVLRASAEEVEKETAKKA